MIGKGLRRAAAVMLAALAAVIVITIQGCSCSDKNKTLDPMPTEAEVTVEAVTDEPTTEPTDEATAEPTAEPVPEAHNDAPGRDGSVVALATGTYGVATDGSVRFMGRSVTGQHYIADWKGVVRLAASDNNTAALLEDGSLVFAGEYAEQFAEATAEWEDIVAIAVGRAHLVGLHSDGTVCAVGENENGQLEVNDWQRVKYIYACGDYTVGVTDRFGEGVYDTMHTAGYPLTEGEYAVCAAPASDHMVILSDAGRVYCFDYEANAEGREMAWSDITKIAAAEGMTYGVDVSGKLFVDGELLDNMEEEPDESLFENVYGISAAADHVALLYGDGTAAGLGGNDDLQCGLDCWRLLPYVTDDGYLLGYSEGDMIGEELYHTGLEMSFGDPVTEDVQTVTAVLLGDVNGDGHIDEADYTALSAHISGGSKLEGAFLRAANIISDSSRPDAVDIVDKDALRRCLDGKCPIDQYAKTDRYTAKLANAKRVNTDALGYITISGTNIDYPIMYGDNWYYHSRGLDGKELTRGSIYTYWATPNQNVVITGHNSRTTGTMLHQLHYVQDNMAPYFGVYKNRLWCINTYGVTGYWEVWSMYEEGAFNNPNDSSLIYNTCYPSSMSAMSDTQIDAWIEYQQSKSKLKYHVDVTNEDTFITLVTCGDTHYASEKGSRLYFFLRWVGCN